MTFSSSQIPDEKPIDRLVRSEEDILDRTLQTRQTSRIVRSMRLILPVAALAVVAVLMIWSNPENTIKPVPRAEVSPQTVSKNELIKPKFQSQDSNNQPYTITADKALQNADNMDDILLDKPVADIGLENGNWVALKASHGAYNQKDGELILQGQVEMHHDTGYELETEQMTIDVNMQTIVSDQAVKGHGPAAEIEAQGLEADGKTDNLIFKGPAKLILRQSEGQAEEKNDNSPKPPIGITP